MSSIGGSEGDIWHAATTVLLAISLYCCRNEWWAMRDSKTQISHRRVSYTVVFVLLWVVAKEPFCDVVTA